jgi:hypothetical protein
VEYEGVKKRGRWNGSGGEAMLWDMVCGRKVVVVRLQIAIGFVMMRWRKVSRGQELGGGDWRVKEKSEKMVRGLTSSMGDLENQKEKRRRIIESHISHG